MAALFQKRKKNRQKNTGGGSTGAAGDDCVLTCGREINKKEAEKICMSAMNVAVISGCAPETASAWWRMRERFTPWFEGSGGGESAGVPGYEDKVKAAKGKDRTA